ncbi:monooxygenase [Rhodococcus sp. D2-41]|uniref:YdhR family protein n=1 Tax=Speluncibacter jeojiensis TaxID=2710754 RepID=UPI00240F75B8|nr:YdhR family protein [Rhodococcus sp. D2-41]MDG3012637.1 monooxygenase [Rhodococcus sp. D2-41]
MVIVRMRFDSKLSEADQEKLSIGGLDKFRQLPGLKQKYYVRNRDQETVGGIYFFETREAAEAYVNGPIVASVGDRFKAEGAVEVEILDIELTLHDDLYSA